ncbi:hypothetical protein ACM66B_006958 [Microbotryomycetes sp. NB124-2]
MVEVDAAVREKAEQFHAVTGTDDETAIKYILRFKDVETATNAFLDGQSADPVPPAPGWRTESVQTAPAAEQHSQAGRLSNVQSTAHNQSTMAYVPSSQQVTLWGPPRVPPQSPNADIDLTKDSDDADLAKAVAMSRQDSSAEDRELNEALAQSLGDLSKDDAQNNQRAAPAAFSIAPESRIRVDERPVALRSGSALMGDLAAYVQCLYAVPTWRNAILKFKASQQDLGSHKDVSAVWHGGSSTALPPRDSTVSAETWMVIALQRLFVLMRETKRAFLHTTELEDTLGAHATEFTKPGSDATNFLKEIHEGLAAIVGSTNQSAADDRFVFSGRLVSKADPPSDAVAAGLEGVPSSAVTEVPLRAFSDSPDDLYSALSRAFAQDEQATIGMLTTVPETLAIRLQREQVTSLDQFGSNKPRQLFVPPAELYLDRFMLRNRAAVIEASQKQSRLGEEIAQLRAALRNIATTGDGQEGSELLQSGLDVLIKTQASTSEPVKLDRRNRLLEKLQAIRDTVKQSMQDYDQRVRALELESASLLDDSASMRQVGPFELRAILMRNGLNGRGSSWAVARDDGGKWWRVSEFVAEEVALDAALADRSGLHMGAGAAFLFYQNTQAHVPTAEITPALKDLALLDNHDFAAELPPDVTQTWKLPPKPDVQIEDGSGLAEPVEEILAFSREDAASPAPVDVMPEFIGGETIPSEGSLSPKDGTAGWAAAAGEDATLRLRGGSAAMDVDPGAEQGAPDDEDDVDENDEDEVELGVLKPIPDNWDVDFSVGKVGGIPRYLDPRSPLAVEDVKCRKCGAVMPLLLQINSPDDSRPHAQARAIYVFVCSKPDCNTSAASIPVRIWRTQMPSPNAFFPHTPETQSMRAELESRLSASTGLQSEPEQASSPLSEWDVACEPEPYEESYLPGKAPSGTPAELAMTETEFVLAAAVPASDGNSAEDAAEPDTRTGVDSAFLRFQERIERLPEQVLRFYRLPDVDEPEPLWANERKVAREDLAACPLCGGRRQIEFQVVSTLLNFVKNEHLNFDSLLAYTCADNCLIPERAEGLTGWAEEVVISQAFADQGVKFGQRT